MKAQPQLRTRVDAVSSEPSSRVSPGHYSTRMAMIPRERTPYSAIVDRPPLKLPGGARVVVWTIVNLEVWDIARAMARQVLPAPTGAVLLPDVPNWSWHEYGMRVGFWRFEELYRRVRNPPAAGEDRPAAVPPPHRPQTGGATRA